MKSNFKNLFMKYINLSEDKFKHMQNKLDEAETLDEAFSVVKEKIVLSEYVIKKITEESKTFTDEDSEEVEKQRILDEEKKAKALEEAARVKAEAKKQGEQARSLTDEAKVISDAPTDQDDY